MQQRLSWVGVNGASDGADPIPDPEIPASLISHCVRNALTLMHIRGTRRRPASQASRDASHLERYLTQRAKFIKAGCGPDPIITFCRARTQTRSRISQLGCGMMPRRTTLLQRTGGPPSLADLSLHERNASSGAADFVGLDADEAPYANGHSHAQPGEMPPSERLGKGSRQQPCRPTAAQSSCAPAAALCMPRCSHVC